MKFDYDLLIAGTTFAGIGAAYSSKEKTIVIERTLQVGYEYINSYNPGTQWNETQLTEPGVQLKQELLERNILSEDGKVHMPAVADVLYNFILKNCINVTLMAEILAVRKKEQGFEIEVYDVSGIKTIKVKKILDTTPVCSTNSHCTPTILQKHINTILGNPENYFGVGCEEYEKIQFIKGKLSGEIIMKFKIDPEDDWVTARSKLHNFWLNRPQSLKHLTIASVASYFDISTPAGPFSFSDQWNWLPSCAYANPLEAFEAGCRFVKGEELGNVTL